MLVVGLTGGIGSGKSMVAEAFAKRGVPIIDTDRLARELVAPGQPALQEIVSAFGPDCLDNQGQLDRGQVRRKVFADPQLRERLESILHPRIRQAVRERLGVISAPYCIVAVPLLIETNSLMELMQRVLVVDVEDTVQVQRVMERDQVDEEQVRRILNAQASRTQRLARADDIISNTGTLADLDDCVSALHEKYLSMS
ncbi:MAG: dephospho-CoA kinase [Gammaproteobacteria bacterium]|nr:dephospho-CoA kinase [Gammaproteobacteria bacterium]MCP5423735.1 dephospho-CoA kinase [Gammaproteobacteria bacterium]MCP5459683.1 dephospho-CoA kinase [Gammaproteobacteria bacterium]